MSRRLTIRMYRVGFGDCFLLTFEDDAPKHVLIDCGSITEGDAQVNAVADDVIAKCTPAGGGTPRLELVVATHRHKDHVGGFKSPKWKSVEVGEVWMPWTEDPDDADATRIRNRQAGFAAALCQAASLAGFDADADPLDANRTPAKGEDPVKVATLAMARNALTNEAAMATLHRGFTGAPPRRFLPEKDKPVEARALTGLPGVRIHVLGPPRDEAAIASMNPPAGQAYLKMAMAAGDTEGLPRQGAFRASWTLTRKQFEKLQAGSTFSVQDQRNVDRMAEEPDGELAAAIDRAVNNTSLILMFEAGEEWLLFPGDAQWGDWNGALQDPRARSLMERTTFYKVGHHGSENATPRSLIDEVIKSPITAFFSTKPVKQWPNIPRPPLLKDLKGRKAKIARSDDEGGSVAAGFKVQAGLYTEWTVDLGEA